MDARVFIGTAGWSIPSRFGGRFPGDGTHLERYAGVFPAVEIDSSFYRNHRLETYERWAQSVPPAFRFSVKVPRQITHFQKLTRARSSLAPFLGTVTKLGRKLGPLLVQLPPGLAFDARRTRSFFQTLRQMHRGSIVCEPRHPSWFGEGPNRLLDAFRVARVAADPAPAPGAGRPGGWSRQVYFRLHGSPRMYYSAYSEEVLSELADRLRALARRARVWCIFDNTASGAAMENALMLLEKLSRRRSRE